jgi:hypothetical protein
LKEIGGVAMPCPDCPATVPTQDGEVGCQTCLPQHYTQCPSCGGWYPTASSCDDCVTCERCDTITQQSGTVETVRGSTICGLCRQRFYWQCEECDGWNRDGSNCAAGCSDHDGCDCEECSDGNGGLVHDYAYKPRPVFHGCGPLFLGPEIEIQTPYSREYECAEIAHSYLGSLGYLKTDSSINHGFEIVTHPMSYDWAIANFPWPMLTRLRQSGCAATDDTGIHVHVSRAGFASACHTYRWMKFIYRNEQQVTKVARRACHEWAAFTDDDRRAVKDYAKGARGARYRAINTNNRDTFELRIFASSLDPGEVKAALGFAAASVEYTRDLTIDKIAHDGGWTWPAFVAWLADQATYQPLIQQLEVLECVS